MLYPKIPGVIIQTCTSACFPPSTEVTSTILRITGRWRLDLIRLNPLNHTFRYEQLG